MGNVDGSGCRVAVGSVAAVGGLFFVAAAVGVAERAKEGTAWLLLAPGAGARPWALG